MGRVIRRLACMGLLAALAWSSAGPAWGAASPPSSPEAVKDYLSGLSDAELGALVRGRLDPGASTDDRPRRDLAAAAGAVDQFRDRLHALLKATQELPTLPGVVAAKFDEGDHGGPLRILGLFLLMVAVGWSVEILGERALRDVSRRVRASLAMGPLAAALRTLLLLVLGVVRIALFGLGALIVFLARYSAH